MEYVILFCRCSLIGIFLWAVVGKLRDFQGFIGTVNSFRLLPMSLGKSVAVLSITAEVSVVLLLVFAQPGFIYGFSLATMLLAVFTCAMLSAMQRGLQIGCNCFGKKRSVIGFADIVRNVGMLAVSGIGCVLSIKGVGHQSLPIAEAIVVGLFAVTASFMWIQLKELLYLFRL